MARVQADRRRERRLGAGGVERGLQLRLHERERHDADALRVRHALRAQADGRAVEVREHELDVALGDDHRRVRRDLVGGGEHGGDHRGVGDDDAVVTFACRAQREHAGEHAQRDRRGLVASGERARDDGGGQRERHERDHARAEGEALRVRDVEPRDREHDPQRGDRERDEVARAPRDHGRRGRDQAGEQRLVLHLQRDGERERGRRPLHAGRERVRDEREVGAREEPLRHREAEHEQHEQQAGGREVRVDQAAAAQLRAREVQHGWCSDGEHQRSGELVREQRGGDAGGRGGDPTARTLVERAQHQPQRGQPDRHADALLDELDREVGRARAARRERRRDEAGRPRPREPHADRVRGQGDQGAAERRAELRAGDRVGRGGERQHPPERQRRGGVGERAVLEQRADLEWIEEAVDAHWPRRPGEHVPARDERGRDQSRQCEPDRDAPHAKHATIAPCRVP